MTGTDRHGTGNADRMMDAGELMRALRVGGMAEVEEDAGHGAGAGARRARPAAFAALAVTAAALAFMAQREYRAGATTAQSGGIFAAADHRRGSVEVQGDSIVKTRKLGSDVVLGAAAAAAVAGGALAGDAVQWRVQDGGNGHWYRSIPTTGKYWQDCRRDARSNGGHLATIGSDAENNFVRSLTSNVAYWIGAKRDGSACSSNSGWSWDTNESFDYFAWANTQPDCWQDGQLYVAVNNISYLPGWHDYDDTTTIPFAITEWEADCNSDGIVDYGQILSGQLADTNGNGVPDICECAANPGLPSCCIGDIVADRTINGADLGTLLAYWGPRTTGSFSIASDLNGDGRIDGSDLGILLANWGACPAANVPSWATLIETQPDPAVVTDASLRAAIAATGLPWRVRDTGTGIEMLLVPPGTFQMGCSAQTGQSCNPVEIPSHLVTISKPYYLGRYEVTQAEWIAQKGTNPSYFQGDIDSARRPVDQVDWNMAHEFTASANLRLPSEAEWENACRAGTTTAFSNGFDDSTNLSEFAWWGGNSGGRTHVVGQLKGNNLGFHDMPGNVWEWTSDWYYDYTSTAQTDPHGPSTGSERCLRGSSYFGEASTEFRSSYRGRESVTVADRYRGFRVARNP